jgi:hypothetical protein
VGSRVEKYSVGVIHIYKPLPCTDARTSPKKKNIKRKEKKTKKEEKVNEEGGRRTRVKKANKQE